MKDMASRRNGSVFSGEPSEQVKAVAEKIAAWASGTSYYTRNNVKPMNVAVRINERIEDVEMALALLTARGRCSHHLGLVCPVCGLVFARLNGPLVAGETEFCYGCDEFSELTAEDTVDLYDFTVEPLAAWRRD